MLLPPAAQPDGRPGHGEHPRLLHPSGAALEMGRRGTSNASLSGTPAPAPQRPDPQPRAWARHGKAVRHPAPWQERGAAGRSRLRGVGRGGFSAGLTHSLPLGRAAGPGLHPVPRRAPPPPPRCPAPRPRRSPPAASAAWHSSAGHLGTKGEKAELTMPPNALPAAWWRSERRGPGAAPARPGLTRCPSPSPLGQAELGQATATVVTAWGHAPLLAQGRGW